MRALKGRTYDKISMRPRRIKVGFKGIVNTVDEACASHEYATRCDNFIMEGGVLKGGIGIDKAKGYYQAPSNLRHEYPQLPNGANIRKIFLYRRYADSINQDKIMVQDERGYFWQTRVHSDDTWFEMMDIEITGEIDVVNYNYDGQDVLLIANKDRGLFRILDASAAYFSRAPFFESITVHGERVFGALNGTQKQVWFSKDFNPSNWDVNSEDAGFITFADGLGDVIKIVSFLNYLYIFREYGIFRLTAYGDQSEFILKKVFTDTGYIYKNTIVQCEDKIIFYTDNGIFKFDGYDVSPIAKEIPPLYNGHKMMGAYLNGSYYLACRAYQEGTDNNAIVRYEISKNDISVLYGYNVKCMCSVVHHNGADVLCAFADNNRTIIGALSESGVVYGLPTKKHYVSPINNLSINNVKVIRDISLKTSDDITLIVNLDGKKSRHTLEGKNAYQKVVIERSGVSFGIEIECDSALPKISPLTVNIDIVDM